MHPDLVGKAGRGCWARLDQADISNSAASYQLFCQRRPNYPSFHAVRLFIPHFRRQPNPAAIAHLRASSFLAFCIDGFMYVCISITKFEKACCDFIGPPASSECPMSALNKRPTARQGRDRRSSPVRASAPIAAQFEDCLQSYDQLYSVMQTNGSAWGTWYTTVDDDLGRLQLWGKSTGASSRSLDHSLDHALRKASHLRETTLQLLTELYESLQSGMSRQSSHNCIPWL